MGILEDIIKAQKEKQGYIEKNGLEDIYDSAREEVSNMDFSFLNLPAGPGAVSLFTRLGRVLTQEDLEKLEKELEES